MYVQLNSTGRKHEASSIQTSTLHHFDIFLRKMRVEHFLKEPAIGEIEFPMSVFIETSPEENRTERGLDDGPA